jgi:hypothetical protein
MVGSLRFVAVLATVAAVVACQGEASPDETAAGGSEPAPATPSTATAPDLSAGDICPLTLANASVPEGVDRWAPELSYGNGKLWTQFWPHNVVVVSNEFVRKGGAIRMKWPWWRGVRGELTIEGRRLDGETGPLTAEVPEGYGPSGFQPSEILFAAEGCWEVTGTVADTSLTFVTLVVKASTYGLEPSR